MNVVTCDPPDLPRNRDVVMTGPCSNGSDFIKEHFRTSEGIYKLVHNVGFYTALGLKHPKMPLPKVTLFTIKDQFGSREKIVYNLTKDLYLLNASDLLQLDTERSVQGKHTFKDKCPTCHDVNLLTRSKDSVHLLVGTTDGQVHLINPLKWEFIKIYNENYAIENGESSVTCVKWIPGSETQFIASFSSGNMYIFNTTYCTKTPMNEPAISFTLSKQGDSYNILVHRGKSRTKEIVKWELKCGQINEFSFSPDTKHLAVVSQDGFLRVFDFTSEDLVSAMRSYFGGLLCVCWSPDGRYIVTGGEDDLVTVWSLQDHKITARGEGHKSWVTMVTFDPYNSKGIASNGRPLEEDNAELPVYRFGSVGQDAHIFFWDLCEDSLEPVSTWRTKSDTPSETECDKKRPVDKSANNSNNISNSSYSSFTLPLKGSPNKKSNKVSDAANTLPHRNKFSKLRSFVRHSHSDTHLSDSQLLRNIQCYTILDSVKVPRLYEVPRIDPLVSKRVSSERLTCIVFTKDHVLLSCNEGNIYVWSRPTNAITS